LNPRRVLIVDDDKVVHTYLKALLEKEGFKVFSALDAMQAPMMARQVKPDLIVLDIGLPAGDGYAVHGRIRSMSWTLSIPILVYTSRAKDEVLQHLPESGDLAYLSKPASGPDFLAAIHKLLGE